MAKPKFNALVASAERIRGAKLTERKADANLANNEAVWKYYDTMGELGFGVTWFANTISRIRLTAAQKSHGGEEPSIVTGGPAADLVDSMAGGISGQSQLLWAFGNLLPMTGDMYLVAETMDDETSWKVFPPEAIRVRGRRGNEFTEVQVDNTRWRALPDESLPIRVWRSHPRWWWRAQSPAQVALPILVELERINQHVIAALQSRLAGAGILIVPNEVTFAPNPNHADAPDPFVAELIEIMTTPIQDPGSASAVVPMVIRVPAQYAEAIRHVSFTIELDRQILKMRDSAINRLATTLDLPAEVLLGLGGVNHWSGWMITEEAFKTHVAPAIELICDAITRGYLWPALKALGLGDDAEDWIVWYDHSELTVRPDHSENVMAAYDRYEASGTALRRELGLDESDKPTADDLKDQVLKKMLNHPTIAELAARELGFISDETVPKQADSTGDQLTGPEGPTPNSEAAPTPVRGEPTTPPRNGAPVP